MEDIKTIELEHLVACVILSFCENAAELGCPKDAPEVDMWFRYLSEDDMVKVSGKLIDIMDRDSGNREVTSDRLWDLYVDNSLLAALADAALAAHHEKLEVKTHSTPYPLPVPPPMDRRWLEFLYDNCETVSSAFDKVMAMSQAMKASYGSNVHRSALDEAGPTEQDAPPDDVEDQMLQAEISERIAASEADMLAAANEQAAEALGHPIGGVDPSNIVPSW